MSSTHIADFINRYMNGNGGTTNNMDAQQAKDQLMQMLQGQQAQNQYQQALAQQGGTGTTTGIYGGAGGSSTGGYGGLGGNGPFGHSVSTGTGGQWISQAQGGPSFVVPPPTGRSAPIKFIDASGNCRVMDVDVAYAAVLSNISEVHRVRSANLVSHPIPAGDFSEDEMELAESVINEMAGKHDEAHQAQ
jgi:hypothetical protein